MVGSVIRQQSESPVGTLVPGNYDSALSLRSMDVLRILGWPPSEPAAVARTLGVTSCSRGEGVTTLAAHLAATAASYRRGGVLLVDGNVVHPAIHSMLGMPLDPGLAGYAEDVCDDADLVRPTAIPDLHVVSAGCLEGSPARLYGSPHLPWCFQRWAGRFQLMIVDMPPVGQASCVMQLAGLMDRVLLVIKAERATREAARRAKQVLESAGARLLGCVFNHAAARRRGRFSLDLPE
jgi:Mrp family chromosome partitioning ATPase